MFISKRRLIHAFSYETILLVIIAVALSTFLDMPLEVTGTLGIAMAVTSVVWNMIFNYIFEGVEKKYQLKRTIPVRILHAIGFEGGLMLATIPMVAYALKTSLLEAFLLDLAMTLCILVYTFIFQWCYDIIERRMVISE
ncbi:chlorhexidine efflux PACE transporter AceI [Acinetobacter nectaris]|nr:chlorhexidine efflux PACE transporter AceI [Acinetobacter nectaris]